MKRRQSLTRHDEEVVEHERVWVLSTPELDETRAAEAKAKAGESE